MDNTKLELEYFIRLFKHVQSQIYEIGIVQNNLERAQILNDLFEVWKGPLLYAWEELFSFGSRTDFLEYGEAVITPFYINFVNQPTEAIEVIIESWNSEPPYDFLGDDPLNKSKRILNLFHLIKNNLAV
jgi:hypothetical protein